MTSLKFATAVHVLLLLAHKGADSPEGAVASGLLAGSIGANAVVVRRVLASLAEAKLIATRAGSNGGATDGTGMERYRESVEQWDLHFTSWHNEVWKPVITAVNGICAGGGFHWIADSDIVLAASDAQFFDPHTSIGQVVSIEAIGLMKRMPVEAVMRMAFVGRYERMPAQRAYELGMVSEVVDPPDRLRAAAQELAEKIARDSGSLSASPTPTACERTRLICNSRACSAEMRTSASWPTPVVIA